MDIDAENIVITPFQKVNEKPNAKRKADDKPKKVAPMSKKFKKQIEKERKAAMEQKSDFPEKKLQYNEYGTLIVKEELKPLGSTVEGLNENGIVDFVTPQVSTGQGSPAVKRDSCVANCKEISTELKVEVDSLSKVEEQKAVDIEVLDDKKSEHTEQKSTEPGSAHCSRRSGRRSNTRERSCSSDRSVSSDYSRHSRSCSTCSYSSCSSRSSYRRRRRSWSRSSSDWSSSGDDRQVSTLRSPRRRYTRTWRRSPVLKRGRRRRRRRNQARKKQQQKQAAASSMAPQALGPGEMPTKEEADLMRRLETGLAHPARLSLKDKVTLVGLMSKPSYRKVQMLLDKNRQTLEKQAEEETRSKSQEKDKQLEEESGQQKSIAYSSPQSEKPASLEEAVLMVPPPPPNNSERRDQSTDITDENHQAEESVDAGGAIKSPEATSLPPHPLTTGMVAVDASGRLLPLSGQGSLMTQGGLVYAQTAPGATMLQQQQTMAPPTMLYQQPFQALQLNPLSGTLVPAGGSLVPRMALQPQLLSAGVFQQPVPLMTAGAMFVPQSTAQPIIRLLR